MVDQSTPAKWMARASEARDIAERMDDPLARKTMLEIAAGYERLAAHAAEPIAPITAMDIYRSSNGDRWRLISDSATGRRLVRHEPNPASGGQVTETTMEDLLAVNGAGPEYDALRRMLGSSGEQAGEVDH
jgi:hypothetical protein